jgi:glutamate/aspartate transport system substrate-binding protein
VVTTTGATAVQHLRAFRRATGIELLEVFGRDHADSFRLLASGRADAFVMDAQILASLIARAPDPAAFDMVGEPLATEPIAIALRRDDAVWLAAINTELAALMAQGEVAALYERWFMQPVPPDGVRLGLPASAETRAAWARPGQGAAGAPPAVPDGRQRRPPPPDPVTTR